MEEGSASFHLYPPLLPPNHAGKGHSNIGKQVLAVYAALLLGFAVLLQPPRLLAQLFAPMLQAAAQARSPTTAAHPAGQLFMMRGRLLTGRVMPERWRVVCFPGQGNYDRLYACTDPPDGALAACSRSRCPRFCWSELRPHSS